MIRESYFPKAVGFDEAGRVRRFETRDIVRRLGVISPDRVFINNYPIACPVAVFNPTLMIVGENAVLYARMVLGYFMYASAVVTMEVPLDDILDGGVNINYYSAQTVIYPSTRYDMWGCEDPRAYEVNGKVLMTYTGRSVNYFNPAVRRERTLPLTVVKGRNHRVWFKKYVHVMHRELREHVVSDKDAFIAVLSGRSFIYHRPHMDDEVYYLTVSEVGLPEPYENGQVVEVESLNTKWVLPHTGFEKKIGWSVPLLKLRDDSLVTLVHGIDKELEVYRVFAAQLRYSKNEGVVVEAVTPTYVMEPQTPYELFGDRPYTIFPCGAWVLDSNTVLLSYGSADFMIGVGSLDIPELLGELDKGRIYI